MSEYKATIGLEIHAELKTDSKMFCSCKNDPFVDTPNIYICPVCTGQPGALPTTNKSAVELMVKIGLAIGADIANYTEFDRKSYFYPDLPKGFQISQYKYPIVSGGSIAGVKLTRIHLEEDTAKSIHKGDSTLVNFNRSGVPLMELVTEPVIHDAKTALIFAKELQRLLRRLNASDADMEKGQMRIEANVSVSNTDELGTKVELKNINSFKAVEKAIEYEIDRQINLLKQGKPVVQQTRGWDETKLRTFEQRTKEAEDEYRYFPEPDLPKLFIDEVFDKSELAKQLPELPWQIRERLLGMGIKKEYVDSILDSDQVLSLIDIFAGQDKVSISPETLKVWINFLLNDLKEQVGEFSFAKVSDVSRFASAIKQVLLAFESKNITSNSAVSILSKIITSPENIDNIESLIAENTIIQDQSQVVDIARQVIQEHPNVVDEYRSGKEKAIMFLVGQVMKQTKGKFNPQQVLETLKSELST